MSEQDTASGRSSLARRRTPCVGICSTTYGDLVCFGCKRFSHEIIGWNSYDLAQREQVELRLATLVAGSLNQQLVILDRAVCAAAVGLEDDAAPWLERALYRALRGPAAVEPVLALLRAGEALRPRSSFDARSVGELAVAIGAAVEAEFLARSKAAYERSFKVSAD